MLPSVPTRNYYLNVPNYISFLRVALIPVVLILIGLQGPIDTEEYRPTLAYWASALFVVSGISDLVDGYLARRMKLTSIFGKFLDPLADKLMILSVMIMLIPKGELPAWVAVVFMIREFAITTLRSVAAGEGTIIPADAWGKKKTALQNAALTCFLLPPRFIGADSRAVGWVILILALIVGLGSGVNYVVTFFRGVLDKNKNVK